MIGNENCEKGLTNYEKKKSCNFYSGNVRCFCRESGKVDAGIRSCIFFCSRFRDLNRFTVWDGMDGGLENHSPNFFFMYRKKADGENWIVYDEEGNAYLAVTSEDPGMTYLHEFTCMMLNEMPDADKQRTVDFLEPLVAVLMADAPVKVDDVEYTKDNILDFVLKNQETAAMVVAYLLKYIETYMRADRSPCSFTKCDSGIFTISAFGTFGT